MRITSLSLYLCGAEFAAPWQLKGADLFTLDVKKYNTETGSEFLIPDNL